MLLRNKHGHGGTTSVMDPEYYKNLFQNIIKGQENPKFKKFAVKIGTEKNVQDTKYHPQAIVNKYPQDNIHSY